MPRTDFIGDFLTMVRNASRAHKDKVTVPSSKMTQRIAELLKEEGFVDQVKPFADGKKNFMRIQLKYIRGKKSAIQGLKRISKPGLRRYVGCEEIPKIQGGLGVAIVSTSKGIITDRKARQDKLGGELLCTVW
ncbi:MAG TPA: 30S ribosomal protein S8 [Verrucomicrobiae bacterium]|jgi:small subunit ribosomal protein S8|nr:30S ribosomal protein S8 [Verrucomicrobiae bacterium]